MLKISYTGCLGLPPVISAQFILEICVAASNRTNFTETRYFSISRSFKVIDVGTPGKLVSSIFMIIRSLCLSATVLMLDELIAVQQFLRGYPSLMPSFEGNLLNKRHEIWSQKN